MPPKPAESSKVQPKKETVRINLPPKPTSAPTIKLPTLAPGSAPNLAVAGAAAPAAPVASRGAPAPLVPSAAAPASRVAAPAKPAVAPAPAPAPRPMAPPAGRGVSGLDKGLAIGAAVAGLAALGVVIYLVFIVKDTIPT